MIKHRRDRTYTIDNYKGYFNDFVKEYECNNEGNLTLETESIYVGGTVTIKNEWEGDLLVKKISVWDYAYDYITDTTEFSYIDGINKWESLTKEYFNESSPACDSVFFKIPSL